jgi:hypothetical protein
MTTASPPRLSRTEWSVVALALVEARKRDCSIPPRPGSFRAYAQRAAELLIGTQRSPGLANAKLEAVRRFVCETRRRRRAAEEFIPELLDHGFNAAQIEALTSLST